MHEIIRIVVTILALIYACRVIYLLAKQHYTTDDGKFNEDPWGYFHIAFWVLGPPVYFYCEYLFVDLTSTLDPDKTLILAKIEVYSDYASKVWAAVLVVILILFSKKT